MECLNRPWKHRKGKKIVKEGNRGIAEEIFESRGEKRKKEIQSKFALISCAEQLL